MNDNKLIYGRSPISRIVGLECDDNITTIFTQEQNGEIVMQQKPHTYWILSDSQFHKDAKRLDGDLHYKWAKRFDKKTDFFNFKRYCKTNKIDTFNINNVEEAAMVKDGYTFFREMKQDEVSVLSFDIETTGLDPFAPDAKVLLISTTYRDHTKECINRLFALDEYESEAQMIDDFCLYLQVKDPSIVMGHNIFSFDFPYLAGRAKKNNISLVLGRDSSEIKFDTFPSKFRLDGTRTLEYNKASIYGREIVDTYFLSVSFDVSKSIETYALKPMIKQLGFEKEGRQYYDAGLIKDNYTNPEEWKKIKQYAIEDAEDPIKLWDYMGPLYFNMCPMIPKPLTEVLLSASGSKINGMMVRAYLQDGHSIPKADEITKFEGAISFGIPGIYKNCFKIDLAALYPNIILEYSVYDEDKDPKQYLLKFVKIFKENRLKFKKLAAETGDDYWKQMDTTAKSILNSFYGFLGASGLCFNSLACAEFITRKGREILEFTIKWASGKKLKEFMPEEIVEEEVEEC